MSHLDRIAPTLAAFGNYDYLEYTGIWVIALVMTTWGMTAALIAGVIAALSTYAVQVSWIGDRGGSGRVHMELILK